MILCGGDALIDFVPVRHDSGAQAFVPRVGGAVLNAATALARLGQQVSFIGALSTDLFGDMLASHMEAEGIATDHLRRSDDDSTLAFVTLTNGEAQYAFYDATSAGRRWTGLPGDLPVADALHIGSVTLIDDPSAGAYEALARQATGRMVVSLDPNCRPGLIRVPELYRARIRRIAAVAHVIRFSDEDFAYLYPDEAEETVARDLLSGATRLVVVSRGADGATAFWRDHRMDHAARTVAAEDTIGAGDTFHAGLLASLKRSGQLSRDALDDLDEATVEGHLAFATTAAALNCAVTGCDPPPLDAVLSAMAH